MKFRVLKYLNTSFLVYENGEVWANFSCPRKPPPPRKICGSRTQFGYQSMLIGGRKGKRVMIHRVVAELFLPNPEKKRTVNHKDGNKQNNAVSNLEWATHSENHLHSFRELGRVSGRKGKPAWNRRLKK